MNKALLRQVAAELRGPLPDDIEFDMNVLLDVTARTKCCCIAGYTYLTKNTDPSCTDTLGRAQDLLDLTEPQADALFLSTVAGPLSSVDVSPLQAAEAIDRLAEGQFPWQRSQRFAEDVVAGLADEYDIDDLVESFPNAPGSLWLDPESGLIEQETE